MRLLRGSLVLTLKTAPVVKATRRVGFATHLGEPVAPKLVFVVELMPSAAKDGKSTWTICTITTTSLTKEKPFLNT